MRSHLKLLQSERLFFKGKLVRLFCLTSQLGIACNSCRLGEIVIKIYVLSKYRFERTAVFLHYADASIAV